MGQVLTWAAVLLLALAACDTTSSIPKPLETHQYTDLTTNKPIVIDLPPVEASALMIQIEGYETEFESQLVNSEGTTSSTGRLPYIRTGPILHLVDTASAGGASRLLLIPEDVTKNSSITVKVIALTNDSSRDQARIQAIKDYESATQSTDDESPELWTRRVALLHSAATRFARAGDTELHLWAEFLEAYFTYFPLAHNDQALELARKTRKKAVKTQHAQIELMALQLEGQILIERNKSDSPEQAFTKFSEAENVLQLAISKAYELGMSFEAAWAMNNQGIGYFNQDRFTEAEQHYSQALDLALDLEDGYLEQLVRGNLALVLEGQGDFDECLAMLLEINQQLQRSGSKADLAHNWSEIGRLYRMLFLFPQAVEALDHARELAREIHSGELISLTESSLAHAYFAMGQLDRALSIEQGAIAEMEVANYARELRSGYRLLADIYRVQGDFRAMSAARQRQKAYLTGAQAEAGYLFSLGLDAIARDSSDIASADQFFAKAQILAAKEQDEDLRFRSQFYRCFIESSTGQLSPACETVRLRDDMEAWLPLATHAHEFEMRFLLARMLILQGGDQEAIEILAGLIEDIARYRTDLPGVLGAWYWENRSPMFETYLQLRLKQDQAGDRARDSLLALNLIRNVSMNFEGPAAPFEPGQPDPGSQALRNLLARLDSEESLAGRLEIRQAIDRKLLELNHQGRAVTSRWGATEFTRALAALPPDSALLSFYLSEQGSWAWLADQSGTQLVHLDDSDRTIKHVRRAREGLRAIGNNQLEADLAELGNTLLSPLKQGLARSLYVLTGGELAGFPLEVVSLDGRHLGQDHRVINMLTLEGLSAFGAPSDARDWARIFLAGELTESSAGRAQLPGAEIELNTMKTLFSGAEIAEYSGNEPVSGFTHAGAFADAELIHFASHARINLEYPELSRIMLSGASGSNAGHYLTPVDIRQSALHAELVVLSACETTGVNSFTFDSNLGFVSVFLQSGADAVVASLWPVGDTFTRAFMKDFYSALLTGMSAPEALATTKRRFMAAGKAGGPLDWASFQIYLR